MRFTRFLSAVALIFGVSAVGFAAEKATSKANGTYKVFVFAAKESNVNAFVLADSKGTLIIDSTRNSKEATALAALVRSKGGDPQIIFITHGHPDHFLGIGALRKEFPNAKITVANQAVKDDIISFAQFMDKSKWLESEPGMKPKSDTNKTGFDYQTEITVLNGNQLTTPAGKTLDIVTNFPVTEAAHETILYSKDLNALFASDLVYNQVHLWLGVGVTPESIKNWQAALDGLNKTYGKIKPVIYPGHGEATDSKIFTTDKTYMSDLLTAVAQAKTQDQAKATMVQKYPKWANTDFLLAQSVKNQMELLSAKK